MRFYGFIDSIVGLEFRPASGYTFIQIKEAVAKTLAGTLLTVKEGKDSNISFVETGKYYETHNFHNEVQELLGVLAPMIASPISGEISIVGVKPPIAHHLVIEEGKIVKDVKTLVWKYMCMFDLLG